MSTLSIPVIIMASISFYVGLYHLLIYGRRRQHREDLTFALLCLATCLYEVFCIGLYNSSTVAEGMQWQRAQFVALALFTTAFLWFVSDYTHQKPGIVLYTFSAFFLLAILIQLVDRSDLTWLVDSPSIKEVLLPLGLKITYYETTFGPFTTVQSLMGLAASTYIAVSGLRFYRSGHKREAGPLLLAVGFMYAAALNDTAVSNGLYQFVYTIEYGYMAMIFLMAYSLSNTVMEAVISKEALWKSEERFRTLVETTSDWVWEIDPNSVYTYVSPKVRELLGYEPQEIVGKTPFDLMPPAEAERVGAIFHEIANGPKPIERLENIVRRKDGWLMVLETSGMPFFDANGRLLGYRGIDRDITERKQAEQILQLRLGLMEFAATHSLEELLQKTLDEVEELTNSSIGFYHFVEADQRTLSLQAWSTRTLNEFCQAEGKGLHYPLDQAGVWTDCVRERRPIIHNDYGSLPHRKGMPEGHAQVTRELVVPILRGARIVAILGVGNKAQAYTEKDIEVVSYVADVAWEITERKRAEAEREKLIADLETKNAELERFTYTVSHDLKAPLITIRGFLGFLEKDARTGDAQQMQSDMRRIIEATEKMQRLLSELLELSRIGRIMNPPEAVPFDTLAHEAVELVRGWLEARPTRVTIMPQLPTVYGDRARLVEVLQNLLDNAAKFMGEQPEPQIMIGQQGRDREGRPIFFVRDNGVGIELPYHERVFGLFDKLDARSEGTGIGLALVKRIVEVHGGRIWLESAGLNTGTTFFFTLPCSPEELDLDLKGPRE